ncbi:hypothetical protein R1T40_21130 (plasmid) [Tritonibacter scottomollicae]|uniref:Uncharacterized protein n=1 Tax=Tritonibacter scottomollicae TaxID=483013 RepID=A0ABZ0HMW3_TRISK|nr:hypothetical protein R1T40_21130 [Tritonibacter scottomollicae]
MAAILLCVTPVTALHGEKLNLIYCQAPWGTVIEFYNAPYAQFVANRG